MTSLTIGSVPASITAPVRYESETDVRQRPNVNCKMEEPSYSKQLTHNRRHAWVAELGQMPHFFDKVRPKSCVVFIAAYFKRAAPVFRLRGAHSRGCPTCRPS